jgi:hypothetical protein
LQQLRQDAVDLLGIDFADALGVAVHHRSSRPSAGHVEMAAEINLAAESAVE